MSRFILPFILPITLLLWGVCMYPQAEPTPPAMPTVLNFAVQTRPQAVPTGLTDLIQQNAYLCYADITAAGQNILIQDRQSPAIPWINNALGTASTTTTFVFSSPNDAGCRFFPSGISWQAGSTGVTGYLKIKCFSSPCKLVSGT